MRPIRRTIADATRHAPFRNIRTARCAAGLAWGVRHVCRTVSLAQVHVLSGAAKPGTVARGAGGFGPQAQQRRQAQCQHTREPKVPSAALESHRNPFAAMRHGDLLRGMKRGSPHGHRERLNVPTTRGSVNRKRHSGLNGLVFLFPCQRNARMIPGLRAAALPCCVAKVGKHVADGRPPPHAQQRTEHPDIHHSRIEPSVHDPRIDTIPRLC